MIFDRKAFREYPGDWFDREYWEACDSWWMIVDDRKVGCCAFERHLNFREDAGMDGDNPRRGGSLYIATTGILPAFRGRGLGTLLKSWQLSYAQMHGFTRVVANTRKSNRPMIRLNKKFGFKIIRTTPNYYRCPSESTVVMELRLR
jgi:ribosomal protein S18 acetylase RimI-like enzyme